MAEWLNLVYLTKVHVVYSDEQGGSDQWEWGRQQDDWQRGATGHAVDRHTGAVWYAYYLGYKRQTNGAIGETKVQMGEQGKNDSC